MLQRMSPVLAVRPEGANHQWRRNPPGELSIDPVADERLKLDQVKGAHMNTLWSLFYRRISSKQATPSSPQATASPSMMQHRGRSRASAPTIWGKRGVRSLPGRL
jgi:hypothetical protein